MMLRIEAGESSKRLDLKSVLDDTGSPVSTWTRMISLRMPRLRGSRPFMAGTLISRVLMIPDPGGKLTRVPDILRARVALAGPGRAGRAFARSWTRAGGRVSTVIRRSPAAAIPAELAGATAASLSNGRLPDCDILVLAVPDDVITETARSLAPRIACRLAFHLSGALPSDALAPFRDRGASVASLHPVRPFTGTDEEDWNGAHVAVEGDPEASAAGEDLARAVRAKPFRLTAEAKPIYHASASLAAGGAVAVLGVAVRGWMAAGIPEHVAREALSDLASRATAAAGHQSL